MKKIILMGLSFSFVFSCALLSQMACSPQPGTLLNPAVPTAVPTRLPMPPLLYSNGISAPLGTNCSGVCEGASSSPVDQNPSSFSLTGAGGYGSDTQSLLITWATGALVSGGYSFASLSAPVTANLTGTTTCQFWAEANQSIAVAFDAAGPTGDNNGAPSLSLTTSWQQFLVTIAIGSRSDGYSSGSLSGLSYYFSIAAEAVPGSFPLNVNVDQITFQ